MAKKSKTPVQPDDDDLVGDYHTSDGQSRPNTDEDGLLNEAGSYRVASNELRAFVERWERLDAEKADIAEQQKEVMAEAKARGYDTKILRKVIALRKRDATEVSEEDAILEIYKEALGM